MNSEEFGNREIVLTEKFKDPEKKSTPFVLTIIGDEDYLKTAQGQHVMMAAINVGCRLRENLVGVNIIISEILPTKIYNPLISGQQMLKDAAYDLAKTLSADHYPVHMVQSRLENEVSLYVGNSPGNVNNVWADGWTIGWQCPGQGAEENPVSALAAACLGIAEVFKQAFPFKKGLTDWKGMFSLLTYNAEERPKVPLPSAIELEPMIFAGFGAVGQAVWYALESMQIDGSNVLILDEETLDGTNLNRYLLSKPEDVGLFKIGIGKVRLLNTRPLLIPQHYGTDEYRKMNHKGYETIICAVDTYEGRSNLQLTELPRLIITGATGDFNARVSRHAPGDGNACLLCYQIPEIKPNVCGEITDPAIFAKFSKKPEGSIGFVSGFAGAMLATEILKETLPELQPYRVNTWFQPTMLKLPLIKPCIKKPSSDCRLHQSRIAIYHKEKWAV